VSALPTKALSLYSPWAWAVLNLGKDIENRKWQRWSGDAKFRGWFWLHASMFGGETPGGLRKLADEFEGVKTMAERAGRSMPSTPVTPRMFLNMRGHIVGRARVVDVVDRSDSGWFCGPLGLVLADATALVEPVPCKGALGFWKVPDDVVSQLAAGG
jgi:hypothetical protein